LKQERALYFAFILPHFNYCSETWHFCSKSASAKLEKVNERALRFVFNEKQTQYQELLNKIGLPSLTNQRLAKIVCMVYKAIYHDHAPKSIKKLLDFRNTRYDLRGTYILKLPHSRPQIHDPSDLRQGSRALTLAGPDFLSMCRVFVSYSQPIRFARFDGKSVSWTKPELSIPTAGQKDRGSGDENETAEVHHQNLRTEIVALPSAKALEPAAGIRQNYPNFHSLQIQHQKN